jgi:2'-5' RNA ligase
MTRLFVAVRLPPEVAARLAALERPALPGVRWSVPDQWLVKLRPLGQVDRRVVRPTLAIGLAARPGGGIIMASDDRRRLP